MMQQEQTEPDDFNAYDSEAVAIDEVTDTNIKINPDFYIHTAILKAQNCLQKDDATSGFLQYGLLIDHIEVLCRSAGMISEDYDKSLQTYRSSLEYAQETKPALKIARLATAKFELLMREVFNRKTLKGALKL